MSNDITGGLRNLKGGSIDALRGPYLTVAAANLAIPNIIVDGINFREGKFVEIGVKPNLVTYWWKGGYEDKHLIEYSGYQNTVKSINRADKTLMSSGSYGSGGAIVASINWIHFRFSDAVAGNKYALSGMQGIPMTAIRVVFFNGNTFVPGQNILSNGAAEQIITVPTGANGFGVNVANATGIGTYPSDNAYANTFQIENGNVGHAYQSFYVLTGLDATKVVGDLPQLEPFTGVPQKVNSMNILQSKILKDYDVFYKFNGTSSVVTISPQMELINVGDYLECTCRFDGKTSAAGLGLFGTLKNGALLNVFGYYDSGQIWLRQDMVSSEYLKWTGLPILNAFRKIKLAVVSGGWELFVDDMSYGVKPKITGFIINTIGRAYNTGFVDASFQNTITIHNSQTTLVLNNLDTFPLAKDVSIDATKKTSDILTEILSPIYVSYNPTGYLGRQQLLVFVQRSGTNRYIGITVGNHYDMSELVYSNQFRIIGADDYIYSNGAMILAVSISISAGESELTWKRVGTTDHTGGWHGDEIMQNISFLFNGVPMNLTAAFDLMPCDRFSYIQKSTMHESAKSVGGVDTPVSGHPVECNHLKQTDFTVGKYKTFNRLTWVRSVPVEYIYAGICCLSKMQATSGFNEDYITVNFTGTTSEYLKKVGLRKFNAYNSVTSYSARIESNVITPLSFDMLSKMFVADRPSDSKYYRQTPDFISQIGDIFECSTEVSFDFK